MPRKPAAPYMRVRGKSHLWYGRINGKEVALGPDQAEAFKRFYELSAGDSTGSVTVSELVDGFLSFHRDVKASKPGTIEFYDYMLKRYVEALGNRAADSITPADLDRLFAGWQIGQTTRSNVVRSLRAVHNYGMDRHGLPSNPAKALPKPKTKSRNIEYTEEFRQQVMAALDNARGRPFADFLELLWRTGARPQELRTARPDQYSRANKWIVIDADEAKTDEERVIRLDDECCAILDSYLEQYAGTEGPILRNGRGKRWKRAAVGSWCDRLKKKGLSLTVYGIRHTWARKAVRVGVNLLYIARMMGHKNLDMLHEVYADMSKRDPALADALKQINA